MVNAGPVNKGFAWDNLYDAALLFLRNGYVVIPVKEDKSPLVKGWNTVTVDDLLGNLEVFKDAKGIALRGGQTKVINDEKHELIIIDVDDVDYWVKEVEPKLKKNTVAWARSTWVWFTGPRCPVDSDKHNITCKETEEGVKCSHELEVEKDGKKEKVIHEFNLRDAKRDFAFALFAPRKCSLGKTARGGIEILRNNYALVPPSQHPSGIRYEWRRGNSPFEDGEFNPPIPVDCGTWNYILNVIGIEREEPKPAVRTEAQAPMSNNSVLRELSEEAINKLAELFARIYKPGHRQTLAPYISGYLGRRRVDPVSVGKLLMKLHDMTNDEEPVEKRISTILYSYKKLGLPVNEED